MRNCSEIESLKSSWTCPSMSWLSLVLEPFILMLIGCFWQILVVRVSLSRAFYQHAINGNFRAHYCVMCDLLARSFDGGSRRQVMILFTYIMIIQNTWINGLASFVLEAIEKRRCKECSSFSLADRKKMAHKNSASFKRLKIKTKTLMNAGLARFLSRYV